MKRARVWAAASVALLVVSAGLAQDAELVAGFDAAQIKRILTHSPLGPPPADPTNAVADDPRAARLGQALFFDKRLSSNGEISCATCHDPLTGFVDGAQVAAGIGLADRNSPTVWNAAYQRWLFWDGRADSLWAQALQPIENPVEMGGERGAVVGVLRGDNDLRGAYEALFGALPEGDEPAVIDRAFSNVGKALAAYERLIVSRRAPFDVFVEGLREGAPEKLEALSPPARRGLALFIGKGRCRMCHGGPNLSDGEFHGTGIAPLGGGNLTDPARYAAIEKLLADPFNALGVFSDDREGEAARALETLARGPESWGEFRTPSLRNVALTAPYMHEGQMDTLEDVVHFYSTLEGSAPPGHHQEQVLKPLNLTDEESADLVHFLRSLTDEDIDPALLGPVELNDPGRWGE